MENKIMTPQNMDIFQTFFEQSADPILILENGLFTDCNHAAEQVLHAHKADFLPISPALISPEFQPDGRLSTEKAAEMINIAIEKGSNRFEWVHRRLNGEDFQVELTLTSVHISGRQLIYTVWRDITKRKKVEDAVKASQQKLSLLIDSSPLAVIEWNTNFEVVSWNPAAERIFGYSFEEAKGRHAAGLIVPAEYKSVVDEVWANLLKQTGGTRSTNGNVRKDGRAITCEWYNTPLADSDGTVFGVSSLVEDVTERKQAEDEIKESQQKLSLLIDSSPLAVIEWNTNFEVVSWNPAAERIFGYSYEEAKGRHAAGLIVPAEYKSVVDEVWANLLKQTGGTRSTNGNVRKDGRAITCEWYNTPLADSDGTVFGVSSLVEDVTERKQAEELLQQSEANLSSALRVAQMGYWEFDIPTQMFTFNDQYYSLLGTTAEKAEGYQMSAQKFAAEYVPPEDAGIVQSSIIRAIEATDPNFQTQIETRNLRADGTPISTIVWFRIRKDEQGQTVKLYGVSQDITDRKRLEREIQEGFDRRGYQVQISTEISQEVATASELNELFTQVVKLTKERLGYYHTQLLRYDPTRDAVVLVSGYGETGQKMLSGGHQMPMGSGLIGTAAASGQTVLRPTLADDPDWQPNPLLPDTQGEIAVPIKLGEQVLGVLDIQSDQAGALTEDDRLLLEGLCGQIAVAIEQTRLREEMNERLEEVNRLYHSMSHEGWKTYRENAELPEGFVFDQTGIRPVRDEILPEGQFANIPMKVLGGEVVGSLSIADDPNQPTSPEDYAFLQQVSDQIALALESARLSAQTQIALAQTEKLSEVSLRFAQASNLQELLVVLNEALGIPAVNRSLLGVTNLSSTNEMESIDIVANWWNGIGSEPSEIGRHYTLENLNVLPMLRSNTTIFFNDTFNDERINDPTMQMFVKQNIRAAAVLPLFLGTRQVGVLFLEADEPHEFTPDEIRLFTALSPQIATVLENRIQFEIAQKQAQRESTLNVISQKIQSATTVEAVLQIAARELGHALGAPMTIAQLSMKDSSS
ncbi:MAG: PAS domain S-box protein [Anaerolineales bacterium]|uniref:PAS domain S-box protein n=1 Tax=Candidatus Villigracilis vicinus TaxID=3140679 RepID=UPI0031359FDB|nr:PAS domain S-box protein [Anaerolineales bacterium]